MRVDGPDGPKVLKVLKFDGPLARGLWYRYLTRLRHEGSEGSKDSEGSKGSEGKVSPDGDEFFNSALRNGKPYNRAAPAGNAPLLVLRTTSPGGGSFSGAMP